MSVNEKMTAIADAIRGKTGKTKLLSLDDMAKGISEVYDSGKNELWNIVQCNGTRENYSQAFRYWECDEVIPKYKVVPSRSPLMFGNNSIVRINKELFDLSNSYVEATASASAGYGLCAGCTKLKVFPDIGLQAGCYISTFEECDALETIEVLRSKEDSLYNASSFKRCKSLKNIVIEGVIGKDISFSYSPLTEESMKSIITHLKNYAGTGNAGNYTLTLKDECKRKLQENTQTVELDGEVYTYFELIAVKGWNLA